MFPAAGMTMSAYMTAMGMDLDTSSSSSESSVGFSAVASGAKGGAFSMAMTDAMHQMAIYTDGNDPGMFLYLLSFI
jgi:hypothetical protein